MSSAKVRRVKDEKYIYLTTIGRNTGHAHTVELWFAIAERKIYLSHEGAYTDWIARAVWLYDEIDCPSGFSNKIALQNLIKQPVHVEKS